MSTGENVQKCTRYFLFFFLRRVRATSMTQRRDENTRVHFLTFLPVSVKSEILYPIREGAKASCLTIYPNYPSNTGYQGLKDSLIKNSP